MTQRNYNQPSPPGCTICAWVPKELAQTIKETSSVCRPRARRSAVITEILLAWMEKRPPAIQPIIPGGK